VLHLHTSNRLEQLLGRLSGIIAQPLADPVAADHIVVQNPGMARWVAQHLADRQGISANLSFPLPASFFWAILEHWYLELPECEELDREFLTWRLMAELPRRLTEPAFEPLKRYLAEGPQAIKRFQLCQRVADLFDQYLVYRPDWILAWEGGAEEHWQALLWRAVVAGREGRHRAALMCGLVEALDADVPPRAPLPERISLFGLTALAPIYLQVVAGLARRIDVHLFLLSPCREYWADVVAEREKARRRALAFRQRQPDSSGLLDVGNPLLASMGHAGQELADLLLDLEPLEHEAFLDPGDSSLLSLIQTDVLDLRDRRNGNADERTTLIARDCSLQLHDCHSPMREVQVLHDRLLRLFEEMADLEPREVVVMAPDIDRYAPYVDAVFGAAPEEHWIPWSVSDRRPTAERPLLAAVASLLRLPDSRFTAPEVMALLEVPAVQERFGLDQGGLERLRTWVAESGIRWGLDGEMRAAFDLPPEEDNTWAFGLRRLFLGYALPAETTLYQGIAPYPDVEGTEAAELGILQEVIRRLQDWRERLSRPALASRWPERINGLLEDIFSPNPDEETDLQALRDAVDGMARRAWEGGLTEPLSTTVVAAWLGSALMQPGAPHRFLTGRVTFCNMVPMRSLPFRVVCLLGMNDTDFPRNRQPLGFDLMAEDHRRGDRSRRRDDRYLFLEALLSARDCLYVSWVGRDARDNSRREPSVLVSELLDYVERAFRVDGREDIRELLVVEHPLQPFSRRYFNGEEPKLFSYASHWLAGASAEREAQAPVFADVPLPGSDAIGATLDLDELIRFFANPAEAFLRQRLGLRLIGDADVLEDAESFDPDALDRHGLRNELVVPLLRGEGMDAVRRLLRAQGRLPHGALGDLVLQEQAEEAEAFAARLRPRLPAPEAGVAAPVEVAVRLGGLQLSGWLPPPDGARSVTYRFGRLRASDRLAAWIRHLVLSLSGRGEPLWTTHVARDYTMRIDPIPDAEPLLLGLLEARRDGLLAPLCFFPETSLAWAEKGEMTAKVWSQWNGERNQYAEARDPWVGIAWCGRQPLLESEFVQIARRLWLPLLAASALTKAEHDLAEAEEGVKCGESDGLRSR
jgi:exodeoxyribonuclease V gamma subunit